VETLQAEEGAAFGAALLAGVGARVWPGADEACQQAVRVAARIEPNPAIAAIMDRQYERYRRIYPALREIYPGTRSSAMV
jgi:xylulokinase